MSPKTSENISKNDKEKPVSTDYFSQFSSTSNSGIDIPTVEPSPQIHPSDIPPQRASYEQKLEQQRRRLDRQYRQRAALNFISNIRWSAVFRIMFVILLIIVAVTAWKMRYVIFNSIISFIVSILPIIIMIWLLWYIFRSFLG